MTASMGNSSIQKGKSMQEKRGLYSVGDPGAPPKRPNW
jgi:hypothetical protein